jgi:hypothetical protein
VDVVYFRYIGKRMTSELFQFFSNKNENFGLLGQFANDFWYMIVAAIVFTDKNRALTYTPPHTHTHTHMKTGK